VLRYCAEEFVCELTDRMIGRGWRLGAGLGLIWLEGGGEG